MNFSQLKTKAFKEIDSAKNLEELKKIEKEYLGRNGKIALILQGLKDLPIEKRKQTGKVINEIKREVELKIKEQESKIKNQESQKKEVFDITLPGQKLELGHLHPITQFIRKVINIFQSMGFEIVEGPELELARYNFDLLNVPKDHPARDAWNTFWIFQDKNIDVNDENSLLLRTHTSPVQIRVMEKRKPPVRLIAPGRCFRHEATDPGHETTFYQCEGLAIDKEIKITDLFGTLLTFAQMIFGKETKMRIRASFYPFVEPGFDIDLTCLLCKGRGCSVCKLTGWLEVMPCGMVHPQVLKNMKVDPEEYTGFAFGMGIDRLMMLYYEVDDIRLSYGGDLRFLNQF